MSAEAETAAKKIPLPVTQPVLLDNVIVEPPPAPPLEKVLAEPIYELEVEFRTLPQFVVEPVLLTEEDMEVEVEEEWVFQGPSGFRGMDSVVTVVPEVDVRVEIDERGVAYLDKAWREKFKPLSARPGRGVAPRLAAPRIVDTPGIKKMLNIRLNFRYISREELEELLSGHFYQEYRVTRIVKRMEKIDSSRLVSEILERLREKEKILGLHRLFGRKARRRKGLL